MKRFLEKILLLSLILTAVFTQAVENSIIPVMETFECIENLPSKKFTKNQFNEIAAALEKKQQKIRVVSYNLLFNLYEERLAEENRWTSRLPRALELLREIRPDIISTQELMPSQVQDIVALIGQEFSFFPGLKEENGESYGIFYRTDRFELLSSRMHYPLSMVHLKDLKTNKTFYMFNTHLPFIDLEKREICAHQITQMIEPFAGQSAVILTGDLNAFPTRLDLTDLPFYDGDYIHRLLARSSLKKAQERALLGHVGPISTFTNGSSGSKAFQGTGTPGVILDYIYVSEKVTVLMHAIDPGRVDGHFPSDHMPVIVDCLIH